MIDTITFIKCEVYHLFVLLRDVAGHNFYDIAIHYVHHAVNFVLHCRLGIVVDHACTDGHSRNELYSKIMKITVKLPNVAKKDKKLQKVLATQTDKRENVLSIVLLALIV